MNKSALLIGICAVLNFAACTKKEETVQEEEGKYAVTSPLLIDTSYTKDYVAQIQSVQNVELHALAEGYLERINVDEGQHVTAGQVLFNIRATEYQGELAKAQAEVKEAELELQNTKTLSDKNIVSQTEYQLAQAKLDHAKAEVSIAQLNLSYCEIKAPFDGIIDRIRFKVGSLIGKDELLTSISNNKEVYAYFNVSETEYLDFKAQSKEDQKQEVSLILANGQTHKYTGTIETVEGQFDNETGNIAFRAKFPNPELLLKHGETGKVRLTIAIRNALIVPQKATYDIQDKTFVYVVDQNNIAKSKEISVKQRLSNIYVVGNDISAKDKILLEGLQSVKDGDTIHSEFTAPKEVIDHLQLIQQKK